MERFSISGKRKSLTQQSPLDAMSASGPPNGIASSDSHVIEPPEIYRKYCSSKWRDIAPRVASLESFGDAYVLEGCSRILPIGSILGGHAKARWGDIPRSSWSYSDRVVAASKQRVAAELLFPTVGLILMQHVDPAYCAEFSWAFNRWLAAEWPGSNTFGKLAMAGSVISRSETRRLIEFSIVNGFVGVLLPCRPRDGAWCDQLYRFFFHDLADAGLLVASHAFTRPPREHLASTAARVWAAEVDAIEFLSDLILGGVLSAVPRLRVLFAEAGTWWLSAWLDRLTGVGGCVAELADRVRLTDGVCGDVRSKELVVWGSDYPHKWSPGFETEVATMLDGLLNRIDPIPERFLDGSFWRR